MTATMSVTPPVRTVRRPSRARCLLASEWTKVHSVRSTYWTLATTMGAALLVGVIITHANAVNWANKTAAAKASFDPVAHSLAGFALAQLSLAALGALSITAEYATGMIRTTFTATPQRRAVLAAKATVFATVAFITGQATAFLAFFAGQITLARTHLHTSLGDPGVLRAVIAGGFYLVAVGLISLGVGAIIRHTAGAITAMFALLLVIPQVINTLPTPWSTDIGNYLPSNAAQQITALHPDPQSLPPMTALILLTAYAAISLTAGAILITRRDA